MNKSTRSAIAILMVVAAMMGTSLAQPFQGCRGQMNNSPLLEIQPELVQTVSNGEKYLIQNGTNSVTILNLFGSPYEMGYAAGSLIAEEMSYNIKAMMEYAAPEWKQYVLENKMPVFLIKIIAKTNDMTFLQASLEWNYIVSRPYTNVRWQEEMQGLSDASGVSLRSIIHMNLFPELTQADCTIVGAWGASTEGNVVRQLRALDWSPDAPVNKYPIITVYHSTEAGSNVFANIGFAGFVGSFTAFSAAGIAMAEKVWLPGDSVPFTYYGYPWIYVFRDVAQFSSNLSEAVDMIFHANRTQRIHLGIGSLSDNSFLGFEYSEDYVYVFNDKNYTAYSPSHPQMDGILFWDKHVQPSDDPCLGNIIQAGYGQIDNDFLFRTIPGYHQTGDMQTCVFDFVNQEIWLAYAHGASEYAYTRSPMSIKFGPFFASTAASETGIFAETAPQQSAE